MIRILTTDEPSAVTITVDGRFVGEYVGEVDACIRQALERQKHIRLFLRDVSNIDELGRSLLSRLLVMGVEVTAAGVYSSYVVANLGR